MGAILTALVQLVPLVTSTVSRLLAARASAQGQTDAESLRDALAMIPETDRMQLATIEKALAKKGTVGRPSKKALAEAAEQQQTIPSKAEVKQIIDLWQTVYDNLPG
mgnify:CR=1 FL=1